MCVVADYNAVHKDKCAAEFMKLKDCYLVWGLSTSGLLFPFDRLITDSVS